MKDSKLILNNIFKDINKFIKKKRNKPKVVTESWIVSNLEVNEEAYKDCFATAKKLGCFNVQFYNHTPKYMLEFSDEAVGSQAGISLSVRKVKCISCSEQYGLVLKNYVSRKIVYFFDTDEILLLDYNQKRGKARVMTYKDLTKQIFEYVDDLICHEIIYMFLYNICKEENKEFLSSIKDELLSKKLSLPKNISGLTKNAYINKKGFLEQEYGYAPTVDINNEPLLKSILMQKVEKIIPQVHLQKLWSVDLNSMDVYNIDFRKTKVIAENLYKNFVLETIIKKEKIDRKKESTIAKYAKEIDNYMYMVKKYSGVRKYKTELSYDIDSLSSFTKTYEEAKARYAEYTKEYPQALFDGWMHNLMID